MALYLDSALLDDVRAAREMGFIAGVTTNPALIAKTGRPGMDVLADILAVLAGPVFYQVTADAVNERVAQARAAAALAPGRVVIKIPATTENLAMTAALARDGLRCAVTAVSSPAQAWLAAQAGAEFAIPYVNRLTRQLGDGLAVVSTCADVLRGTPTRLLAASLKSADEVVATLRAGAQDLTIPLDLIRALGEHPLSQQAIEDFARTMRPD